MFGAAECLQINCIVCTVTLELQLIILTRVKSLREADFEMYGMALTQLMPWVFALDHTNYSSWLSIHMYDMCFLLHDTHTDVFEMFSSGSIVANKTKQQFSWIALDQAHEQTNVCMKGDGKTVRLTENYNALRRWMVAGPENARIVRQFEDVTSMSEQTESGKHHEQTCSIQVVFAKEMLVLLGIDVLEDLENPFEKDNGDLYNVATKEVMTATVVTNCQRYCEHWT